MSQIDLHLYVDVRCVFLFNIYIVEYMHEEDKALVSPSFVSAIKTETFWEGLS